MQSVTITGKSILTAREITAFIQKKNPTFDPAIAEAFLKVGKEYNVRGDIAICQSILETGWFKFNGTKVTPDQNNFCGMGVTGAGAKGNSFPTIEIGVTAQIQHLYGYAVETPFPEGVTIHSPRLKYVTRGSANDTWIGLNMKWAMNDEYGQKILTIYSDMLKTHVEVIEDSIEDSIEADVIPEPKYFKEKVVHDKVAIYYVIMVLNELFVTKFEELKDKSIDLSLSSSVDKAMTIDKKENAIGYAEKVNGKVLEITFHEKAVRTYKEV